MDRYCQYHAAGGTGVPIAAAPSGSTTYTPVLNFVQDGLATLAGCGPIFFGLRFSGFINLPQAGTFTFTLGVGGDSGQVTVGGTTFANTAASASYPGKVPFFFTVDLPAGLTPVEVQYASGFIPGNGQGPAAQLSLQASGPGFIAGSNGADQYIAGFQCSPHAPSAMSPPSPPDFRVTSPPPPATAPTASPTAAPPAAPTFAPPPGTPSAPTPAPTTTPTAAPTFAPPPGTPSGPTSAPTTAPTTFPTSAPTTAPTAAPSSTPPATPPGPPLCENPRPYLVTSVYCSYPGTSLPTAVSGAPQSGSTNSQTVIDYTRDGGDLISLAQTTGGCSTGFAVSFMGQIEVPNGGYTFTLRAVGGAVQLYIDGVEQSPSISGSGQESYLLAFTTAALHKIVLEYVLGSTTAPILSLSVQGPGMSSPEVLTGYKQCGPLLPPSPPTVLSPPSPPAALLPPSALLPPGSPPRPSPPNPVLPPGPPAGPPPVCPTLRSGLVADAYAYSGNTLPLPVDTLRFIGSSVTMRIDFYPTSTNLNALGRGSAQYAVRFSGFINVIGGKYTFQLQSGGGGAQFSIDGTQGITLGELL